MVKDFYSGDVRTCSLLVLPSKILFDVSVSRYWIVKL